MGAGSWQVWAAAVAASAALAVACGPDSAAASGGPVVLQHVRFVDGSTGDVTVQDGKISAIAAISAIGASTPGKRATVVDAHGATIVPAVIDSHVHLAYYPVGTALADAGVAAAVDLAAPLATLPTVPPRGPRIVASGPMITAPGGYPTQSWGRAGYGLACADADAAAAAVDTVVNAGAKVVKIPLQPPALDDEAIRRVVAEAHARGLLVVAHALADAEAARAGRLGVDGLAHTPVEALDPATVALWSNRFVISTLRAFGGSPTAVANLRALREAGATVLYGTDLGNLQDVGIDAGEIGLLQQAGLDGRAILDAATVVPAEKWGWTDLGAVRVGGAASFLLVDGDPLVDPTLLSRPSEVWLDGARR